MLVHTNVIGSIAPIATLVLALGLLKVKFWLLTVSEEEALEPSEDTVIVSVPDAAAVTVNFTCPVASVVSVPALSVLPLAEVTVTVWLAMPLPPESVSDALKVPAALRIRLAGPVTDICVPTTPICSVFETVPTVAVTVIVRLLGSPGMVRFACACPLASVTPGELFAPLVAMGVMMPLDLASVENATVAPVTTALFLSVTMAVSFAGVELFEGICGTLEISVMLAAPLVTPEEDDDGTSANELEPPPPHPTSVSAEARIPRSHPCLSVIMSPMNRFATCGMLHH